MEQKHRALIGHKWAFLGRREKIMQFSDEYKKKAVELYREYEMEEVFRRLVKLFNYKPHPNEKTIRRWKKLLEGQSSSNKKSTNNGVDGSTMFITNDGLYKKAVGPIRWLNNGYVLTKAEPKDTGEKPT